MSKDLIHVPSFQKLSNVRGNIGRAFPFMALGIPPLGIVVWDDHFLGDTLKGGATTNGAYEIVTGVDGTAAILADQTNGIMEIAASTGAGASGEYCGLSLPGLNFSGDNYCGMAVRFAIDNVATVKMEIGFTDVTTDAGFVNSLAGNTFTATNACGWVFDTSDTAYWQCVGTKAGTPATKIEPTTAPVGATFETMIVIIEGNNAKYYRLDANSNLTYESKWITSAIEGGTKICPWIFVQLRGSVDRKISLDRLLVWGNETSG